MTRPRASVRGAASAPLKDTYGRLLAPVLLPSFLSALAQQAAAMLLPLFFMQLGMSAGLAAATFGARGMGMMLGDLPASAVVARLGDRRAMAGGLMLLGVACALCAGVGSANAMALLMLVYGMGLSLYLLARLSLVTATVLPGQRGRVLSVLAGIQRLAALIGPFAAGLAAERFGFNALLVCLSTLFLLAVVLVLRARSLSDPTPSAKHRHHFRLMWSMVVLARGAFLTVGLCGLLLMLLRVCRILVIPLLGHQLGLGLGQIGAIVTVSASADLLLFYPAGALMDRHGRRWVLLPGTALLASGFVLLPLVDDLLSFTLVALLLGLANGFTTGVVMTMGADLAPPDERAAFLAAWRLLVDAGTTLGPFLLAALIGLMGLKSAAFVVGCVGMLGVVLAAVFVRETHPDCA